MITLLPEDSSYGTYIFHVGANDHNAIILMKGFEEVYNMEVPDVVTCSWKDFWIAWSTAGYIPPLKYCIV